MLERNKKAVPEPRSTSATDPAMSVHNDRQPDLERFVASFRAVTENVERLIRGKTDAVHLAFLALFAEGHLLIEDVPGVGKTSLARCIARSVGMTSQRIQFTADLLPTDVTGGMVYNQVQQEFLFRRGPVFANIVIGDEINRASPRAQSALLEVMEERQVTVDGKPYSVPMPFMVVATQNPIDLEGTYPLPEAQLDRFMLRISVGLPSLDAEIQLMRDRRDGLSVGDLDPILSQTDVRSMIDTVRDVTLEMNVYRYIAEIAAATRARTELRLGASPRGSIALVRAAQAHAASRGRSYVTPDDVKELAVPVLAHRLILKVSADFTGTDTRAIVEEIVQNVPVPKRFDPVSRGQRMTGG